MSNLRLSWFLGAALSVASVIAAPTDSPSASLSQLPERVRTAIQSQVGSGTLQDVTQTNEDGGLIYDVEITQDGKDREFIFGPTGQLLSAEVSLSAVPTTVQDAIQSHVGNGRILTVTKNIDGTDITYEVDMKKAGRQRSFTVDAKGTLIEMQVFPRELPKAVRETITDQAAGSTLESVNKVIDEDGITFEAEITKGGQNHTLTVARDGELLSISVSLNELPLAAQRSLLKESAGGRIVEIDKSTEEGENSYSADIVIGNQTRTVTVWSEGDLQVETTLPAIPAAVKDALEAEVKNGVHLESIDRTVQDGEIGYEAELDKGGSVRTLDFDPGGTLTYQEEPVALSDTPQAVQTKLAAAPGKIMEINKCNDDGDITYDALIKNEGKTTNLTLTASGEVATPD
jgi:uncharacterized membrane protein YkoI